MSTPKQQFIPGTIDPALADLAEAKRYLEDAEKCAKAGKTEMQKAALRLAELIASRLVRNASTPADVSEASCDYLKARDAYLASTTDAGKAAQRIILAIQEDA